MITQAKHAGKAKGIVALCLLLAGGLLTLPLAAQADHASSAFRIVAYLPDYRVATLSPASLRYVTDLVFFSLEPTSSGDLDSTRLTPAVSAALQTIKQRHDINFPAVRLWVTVGGWERSAGFASMAVDAGKRRRFVQALTQLCLSRQLDGVDFDWEHPAGPAEEAGYTALLLETHRAFAPHHLKLSVTVAAWQRLAPQAVAAVDFVNLMSYDHPGRHSTLAQAKLDVADFVQQGIPAGKICLGIPFYGRGISDPAVTQTYADIWAHDHPAPERDEVRGLYFNGPDTVRQKTRFALASHLSGIMVWELGQDASGKNSLLQAIHQAAKMVP